MGVNTTLSRILGFVRDMVIARFFGATVGTDAFFVAFKIPNFLRRLFAEGAFSQAFVPVLSEYQTQREHDEVRHLVDSVAGTLGLVLSVLTALGIVAAPLLILLFAPGFDRGGERYDLAVEMLRLTFPYLLFISLTALAGGVLNTFGRFGVPAFTPVLLNLSLIGAALWLAPAMEQPVVALAWGVFIAGLAQLAFQIPFLLKLRLLRRPKPGFRDPGVRKIMRLMLPALFGASVTQINLLVDTLIASFLVTGSISWLYYSDRLVEFPLGVFGIALATVILPSLSKKHAAENPEAFSATVDWALRWVLLIGAPATLGLALLAAPLLTTLFQYDAFTAHDVAMAARSLVAYSVGLCGFILVKVLAPGYYARQDTRTPVRIGVIAMVCNIALNLSLVGFLAHAGLALATSLAAFVNAGLLFRGLIRQGVYRPRRGWRPLGLRVGAASTAMALFLWWVSGDLAEWLAWGAWKRAGFLLLWVGLGAAIYFTVLFAIGLRWHQLRAAEELR
ncbi:MAG: murein biosynthesis integral membrane protein MurJ [Gammaproteobacteria bacterium]